jgi:iron complex outermembrane receptor protein
MYRHSLVRLSFCKSICHHLSFLAVFLLLPSLPALAQSVQVSGTIKDPDQSVVSHAIVSLENLQTTNTFQATTNEAGQYTFFSVPQGTYRLEAHKPGFAAIIVPSLTISAGQNMTRDLSFALAGTSTSVTVSGGLLRRPR